jgi:transcriptional regulator GlxA family with amidase domain
VHTVVVLALPDTIAFDLSTPVEIFGRVRLPGGRPGYRVQACATDPVVTAGPLRLSADHGLDALAHADTIVVPGRNDPSAATPGAVVDALRDAAAAGTRIASIWVGAFTLAAAGLLDGRRATTHWAAAERFRFAFPAVDLDPAVLYVDSGQVVTSAGAIAGVDMCLHLVGRDYGTAAAAEASRLACSRGHRGPRADRMSGRRPHRHTAAGDLTFSCPLRDLRRRRCVRSDHRGARRDGPAARAYRSGGHGGPFGSERNGRPAGSGITHPWGSVRTRSHSRRPRRCS